MWVEHYLRKANPGRLDEAEKILIEAAQQDPENPMIHHSLGEIYQKREDWDKAIGEYTGILKIRPDRIDTYFLLAKAYLRKGMIEEAIKVSEAALSLHPKHLKSLLFLASVYKSQNQMEKVLDYIGKAVNAVPSKNEIRIEYAQLLTRAKKYDEAIGEYEFLLKKMPENPLIYNNLGIIYYSRNEFERTIQYLSREVELHASPNSYFLLGLAAGELQRYDEAIRHMEKYLSLDPAADISLRQKAEQALQFFKSKIKK
jgi:tetratricopeptide (TPR) repeat protein